MAHGSLALNGSSVSPLQNGVCSPNSDYRSKFPALGVDFWHSGSASTMQHHAEPGRGSSQHSVSRLHWSSLLARACRCLFLAQHIPCPAVLVPGGFTLRGCSKECIQIHAAIFCTRLGAKKLWIKFLPCVLGMEQALQSGWNSRSMGVSLSDTGPGLGWCCWSQGVDSAILPSCSVVPFCDLFPARCHAEKQQH